MKRCGSCQVEKDNHDYRTMKGKTVGQSPYLCSICKECERNRALTRYHNNRDECIKQNKLYKAENQEKIKETAAVYFQANKDRIRRERRDYMRNYYSENKKEICERMNVYRSTHPEIKLRDRLRSSLLSYISKTKHTEEYIGAGFGLVQKWLEFNFNEEMNWDNYGPYWHIDHTLPIASFNMKNDADIEVCFSWMNLMPLEKSKNLSKKDKIIPLYVFHHERRLLEFAKQFGNQDDINSYLIKYSQHFKKQLLKNKAYLCNTSKLRETPEALTTTP